MSDLSPSDDALAQAMENALVNNGKGKAYITRAKHGMIPAGTSCNVWRTKSMTIGVQIYTQFDTTDRLKAQSVVSYAHKEPPFWVVYEYRSLQWYFADLETEDEHRMRLKLHFKNLKRPPKMPPAFKIY